MHAAGLHDAKDAPKTCCFFTSGGSASPSKKEPDYPTSYCLSTSDTGLNPLPGTIDELEATQTLQIPTSRLHGLVNNIAQPASARKLDSCFKMIVCMEFG
jgi:hypothetical protein